MTEAGSLADRNPPGATTVPRAASTVWKVDVSAARDGVLAGWTVRQGGSVDAGDPIDRLHPEVTS